MYSVHSYYIVTLFWQTIFAMLYPMIISALIYPYLDLVDDSPENYYEFMKTSFLMGLAASTFGFMWGTFFDDLYVALMSSFVFVNLNSLGAGKFVNTASIKNTPMVVLLMKKYLP